MNVKLMEISLLTLFLDAFDYLDAPPIRITGADVPMPYSMHIEQKAMVQVDNIVTAAKRACARIKKN